ncbi:MAG: alpha-ketoglutarate-dependent dioxygenase AlkB [Acidimicrobiales bacterium]
MPLEPDVAPFQLSLLDAATHGPGPAGDPDVDPGFADVTRTELDPTSWIEHLPGWVRSSDQLFEELVAGQPWEQRSRHMYGRVVREPRLTAWWRASSGRPLSPSLLERMRALLSDRYGVELDSMGLNLYRDGRDGVAWHGDRIAESVAEPLVAIVSVGQPRAFLYRPAAHNRDVPRRTRSLLLGHGDLLVTGGAFQRRWEHTVPKVASAGPRISITYRHGLGPRAYPDSNA